MASGATATSPPATTTLASADWMPRNLDRRVEIAFPVLDPGLQAQIGEILEIQLADTVKARRIVSTVTSRASTWAGSPPFARRSASTSLDFHARREKAPCSCRCKSGLGNCRCTPVATEEARRATDLPKLSGQWPTLGGSASRRAATCVKPELASKVMS